MLVNLEGPPLEVFWGFACSSETFLCKISKGKGYRLIPLNEMVLISLFAYKTKQKRFMLIIDLEYNSTILVILYIYVLMCYVLRFTHGPHFLDPVGPGPHSLKPVMNTGTF